MPDITMTRQTSLRGTALQNAINAMMASVGRRSPFNIVPLTTRWESATRLTFSGSALGQQQVSGAIDIRDGSPSTVIAQVNLLTSTARGYQSQVESAMVEESERNMPIVAGASPTQTQNQPSTQTQNQRQSGSGNNSWTQWTQASNILGDLFGGAAAGLNAYNQQMGYAVAQEAVQVAAQEAQNAGVQYGPGFILGPGKTVGPNAPPPGPTVVIGQQPSVAGSFPTWGWVVLGLGGVGLLAFVIWTGVTKHG